VRGIVGPVLSPDGLQIAFAAVGDIYVMRVGERPVNLTNDRALDTDPAWSPDGRQLAYSSDKDSAHLQLWIRDMPSGHSRQVTHLTTQPQGATWSPDGTRLAFFTVTGMWRAAEIAVLDVASGTVTTVHETLAQPGTPTWSPDGMRLALAALAPSSRRFREGTNQVLTLSAAGGGDTWYAPVPLLSIDSRGGCFRCGGFRWGSLGRSFGGRGGSRSLSQAYPDHKAGQCHNAECKAERERFEFHVESLQPRTELTPRLCQADRCLLNVP